MDLEKKQIAPPNSWDDFESLCLALFREIWSDSNAQKNGRRGQVQCGVDVFGSPLADRHAVYGLQCKGKDQGYGSVLGYEEVLAEAFKAERFKPTLKHFTIATTARRDASLQERTRELSAEREASGQFGVTVLAWEDLLSLIAHHRPVLEQFYPEHCADAQGLIKRMRSMPSGDEVSQLLALAQRSVGIGELDASTPWLPLQFGEARDLGPALLGRDLGPADALACPRLVEANALLEELHKGFSVRLIGVPGAGKSVCAYQAANTLSEGGWAVVQLRDAGLLNVQLLRESGGSTLFIIDNAHRMSMSLLQSLEQQASPSKYLISTHNAGKNETSYRGAVTLDAGRAVRTIATSLRANLAATLAAVRRVDDHVGESLFDDELSRRIDAAEETAQYPWQFCFVLGGGWRRTARVADACRANNAELVLAAVAALQLVSRDAPTTVSELLEVLAPAGLSQVQIEAAIRWLISQRTLISQEDLRCPHQRFSAAVLGKIFAGLDKSGREHMQQLCRDALANPRSTLAGCRILIHELNYSGQSGLESQRWVDSPTLNSLLQRCSNAISAEERMHACLLLAELGGGGVRGTPWRTLIGKLDVERLGIWISAAVHPLGYGMHRLLNDIWNNDEDLAREIVESSDARSVARIASSVNADTAYSVGEMIDRIALTRKEGDWHRTFRESLDRDQILETVAAWPEDADYLSTLSNYCWALAMHDRELAFSILEKTTPLIQRALAKDPIEAFRSIDHIVGAFLGTWDILGVRGTPGPRERAATQKLLQLVKPERVAEQLSASTLRELQGAAHFLGFLHRIAPAKARKVRAALDLSRVGVTIGDHWSRLPHEAVVFLCQASLDKDAKARVTALVNAQAVSIKCLPARLAIVAPSAAITVVESGNKVGLGECMALEWLLVACIVHQMHLRRPDLLVELLRPHVPKAVEGMQGHQLNTYEGVGDFVRVMNEADPVLLREILAQLDPDKAEKHWAECLKKGGKPSQSVAHLVEASLLLSAGIAQAAARLRKRFPRASSPKVVSPGLPLPVEAE